MKKPIDPESYKTVCNAVLGHNVALMVLILAVVLITRSAWALLGMVLMLTASESGNAEGEDNG